MASNARAAPNVQYVPPHCDKVFYKQRVVGAQTILRPLRIPQEVVIPRFTFLLTLPPVPRHITTPSCRRMLPLGFFSLCGTPVCTNREGANPMGH